MIAVDTVIAILFLHLLGDFLLQSDWMAINKSKSAWALWCHCMVYSLCFTVFGAAFACITFVTHSLTDAITSRINAELWAANKRHWFFVGIGVDQFFHYSTLLLTYVLLRG